MNQSAQDTICAIATPSGRSGIGVLRVSGPACQTIAKAILGSLPRPRHAHYAVFRDEDGSPLDQGIALYFPAPHSFTGEDVLELQGHGGTQILNALLRRLLGLGARLAQAGEFSERAFINDKIDLLQAEAIADLIDASSEQAMRSAMRTLQGDFSSAIGALIESLVRTRVNVEAAIDFSDEDIDVLSDTGVATAISGTLQELDSLLTLARQGALLKEGFSLVITGRPNAGKSSLMNALAKRDSAIVTDQAGTTRDLLHERINLDGLTVNLTDSAGLRDSVDPVEQEGVRRASQAIQEADHVLLVVDAVAASGSESDRDPRQLLALAGIKEEQLSALLPRTSLVYNKIDLLDKLAPGISSTAYADLVLPLIHLSAQTGAGLESLASHIKALAGYENLGESVFVARQRHLVALKQARDYLAAAETGVREHLQLELIAEDLRLAQTELGRITGQVSSDDLLGEIFSSFCVGK